MALAVALSTHGQSLSFSLDTLSRDSFYLVETYTAAQTKDAPRAGTTVTPQLFRDTAQLRLYIANLRNDSDKALKQAKDLNEQAKQYEQAARLWALKANAIQELVGKSDWFMGRTVAVVKPTETTTTQKPPTGKKTTKKKKT